MPSLPSELIDEVTQRIQDARLRHGHDSGTYVGTFTDPNDVSQQLEHGPLEHEAWNDVVEQMKRWGQQVPPMHVMRGDGFVSASSERADRYPLAPPATSQQIGTLETVIGRPLPEDLRQLFQLANGGWGPGVGFTSGHGTGFFSTEGSASQWEDLRRRGADYCGIVEWPANLVPIADLAGTTGYNLDTGRIIGFNEYFEDDGLTAAEAFTVAAPDLASFIDAWLAT